MKNGRQQRAPGARVVAIGGGTGLSMLLRGLKHYVARRRQESERHPIVDLAAIVTVSDDGGSSGRLRREYSVLPPGDIRNCMVALSQDEALLGRLFQYRFHSGSGLRGHSFGNLFLTALSHVTGDFAEAVKVSGEVLAIRGRIFPATLENVTLEAVMTDGKIVSGETRIPKSGKKIRRLRLQPRQVRPLPEVLQAIAQANLIARHHPVEQLAAGVFENDAHVIRKRKSFGFAGLRHQVRDVDSCGRGRLNRLCNARDKQIRQNARIERAEADKIRLACAIA